VRGPAGFPLHDALTLAKDTMLGFGGHQAAAGVHVDLARLGALRDRFADACSRLGATAEGRPQTFAADARLDPADTLSRVHDDLGRFEPCGHANPAPRLVTRARVDRAREVGDGHLSLELHTAGGPLRAFGIDLAPRMPPVGATVDVMGKLRPDTYRGDGAVELMIDDMAPVHAGL
jgi:single-stranded-DNA-specific exonuclease